jgi:hypothetical protein
MAHHRWSRVSDMAAIIHPSAIVDQGAVLGEDCRVWHFVHISAGARIGARCSFGQNVFVGNDVSIGNNVRVQNNVSIYDAVTLEDDVFCGPSMVFTNVYNPRAAVSRKPSSRAVMVISPPSRRVEMPYFTAFSTSVCSSMGGTGRPRSAGSSSSPQRTRNRSSWRICSKAR